MVRQPYAIWYHVLITVNSPCLDARGAGGMIVPAMLSAPLACAHTRPVTAGRVRRSMVAHMASPPTRPSEASHGAAHAH